MRVLFFGDSIWATRSLKAVLESGHDVAAVIGRNSPTTSCLEKTATESGIEYANLREINKESAIQWVKSQGAELGISVSYDQIFGSSLLDLFPRGVINAHAGKLPHYRGRNIINWALINNESELGITVHYVEKGVDTGPVLVQRCLPIHWEDDYGSLLKRAQATIPELVAEAIKGIATQRAEPQPQQFWEGTFFTRRVEGDEWLNWEKTSLEIYNFVRGITRPGPGARCLIGSGELVVWKVQYDRSWPSYQATPGEIVAWTPNNLPIVKTGDSVVALQESEWGSGVEKLKTGSRFMRPDQVRIQQLEEQLRELKGNQ